MSNTYSRYLSGKIKEEYDMDEIGGVANKIANGFEKEHYESQYRNIDTNSDTGIPYEEQVRILSIGLLNI